MQQVNVDESTLVLDNPGSPITDFLLCLFNYCAELWLISIIQHDQILNKHRQQLMSAIDISIADVNRQVIYGPTGSYVAVADRPNHEHLNCTFTYKPSPLHNQLIPTIQSFIAQSTLSTLISAQQIPQLLWYRCSSFRKQHKFIHKTLSKEILEELEVNGENWNQSVGLPTLLLTLKCVLSQICGRLGGQCPLVYLKLARLCFLHNRILSNPAKLLSDQVLMNYKIYMKRLKIQEEMNASHYTQFILEYCHVLTFYYKFEQSERCLDLCQRLMNTQMEFTGKLGRRTKYQSFDTPQLIMNIKDKQLQVVKQSGQDDEVGDDLLGIPQAHQLIYSETHSQADCPSSQIRTAIFNEQNILLQQPQLAEANQPQNQQQMTVSKILVILSNLQYIWDSTPKDQILYQQISTSIQTLLSYKQKVVFSYPVMFNVLLLRTLNEFPRVKNTERALQQFESLRGGFNLKSEKNLGFLYCTGYVPNVEFIKTMGGKYMELGMVMTAIQLYEQVGMVEECIDGLIASNYKEKAKEKADELLNNSGKTPRLLCMFGDLAKGDQCEQYYRQAWQLSNCRFARAQRSLGWHYFSKKKFVDAAESFKEATRVNYYHPSTWFTLGCTYMQMKEYKKALCAFGQSICIDDCQGEAWGNMASCYIFLDKLKEAYSTLIQAVKHSEKNWKLWNNLLSVSLKLKKFYKYFECIERIVSLEKGTLLNPEILQKIVSIFRFQMSSLSRRTAILAIKRRIDNLYTFLVQSIGQNSMVWQSIYKYNVQLEKLVAQNHSHYMELHRSATLDSNDLLQGYETEQSTKNTTELQNEQIRNSILESKQTQLNMLMKVGWDDSKKCSQEVLEVLKEYIAVFERYGKPNNLKEHHIFVEGVRKKIEHCLQTQIQLQFTPQK